MRRNLARLHGPLTHKVGSKRLRVGSELLPLVPSNHIYYDPPKLRVTLDRDGYLYFKNVIPKELMEKALADVGDQLIANQWVQPEDRKREVEKNGFTLGCPYPRMCLEGAPLPTPTAGFGITKNISDAIAGVSVATVIRQILSGPAVCLPQHTLEVSHPGEQHNFHMDHPLQCRGTPLVLTAWIPLQNVTLSLGGLAVVRGSNSNEQFKDVRLTYGQHDVETAGIAGDGSFTDDPFQIIQTSTRDLSQDAQRSRTSTAFSTEADAQQVKNDKIHEKNVQREGEFKAQVNESGNVEAKVIRKGLDDEDLDELDILESRQSPILSTSFEAGDVVITTGYTMHGFLTNQTHQWRISAESKWIMEGDDQGADPRFSTASSPGLQQWLMNRDDKTKYPKSMAEAKKEWGVDYTASAK